MANYAMIHDIGAHLVAKNLVTPRRIAKSTAGTTVNGTILDRQFGGGDFNDLYHSLKVVVPYNTNAMTTGSSASLTFAVHHSSSTATADFALLADIDGTTTNQTAIGFSESTASTAASGIATADYRLDTCKRYIRVEAELFNSATTAQVGVDYSIEGIFGVGDGPPAN
jgi:hypothetical protein